MIEKVQIADIDTASENGPRTLKIRTKKNIIETPCRMITSTETKFRKDLALSPLDKRFEIETPLFERVYTPKLKTIQDFKRVNGALDRVKNSINRSLRGFDEGISFLNLRFKKDGEPPLDDIESLIHLQCSTKLDLVSIPDLNELSNKKDYEIYVRKHRKYVENISNKEAAPIVDMNNTEDVFRNKIDTIIENGFKLAVLRCRSFNYYYANYKYLRDTKKEEEIWFHMVDTLRDHPYTPLNYTNLPQIFGIDTVSPRTPYGGGEVKATIPEDTKRFDRLSFDNLPLKEQRRRYDGSLGCTCLVCQDRTVSEYIEEYEICENKKERNPVYKWSRIHEIFATNSEFQIGRKFIQSQEFDTYIRSKISARSFLDNLTSRFF
ncbi:MAG: hypothetical protein HXS48_06330 [Theionarchaea archaeon]|nr:hypothetical protein [Theionarchaea archaeon]